MKTIILGLVCFLLYSVSAQSATMRTDTLRVSGNCGTCKKKIESPFKDAKGVETATWDKKSKLFVITYDPTLITIDRVKEQIVAQGYDTEGLIAKDEVYNKLPKCCHYRSGGHDD